jgi:sulfate adenylyltransferase large subunit
MGGTLKADQMELLRFFTAGSVDDGKSTLIGRLLFDSKSLLRDQLEAVSDHSTGEFNLANITDGLRAEREQGITIDVAYRYFNTSKRKFIIADSPGHVQYTRNMVTAASTANLAVILIDARNGVIEQTRRHSYICSLLRIPRLTVCVNKMDAVNYDKKVFDSIRADYEKFAPKLNTSSINFIPVSALEGDNIISNSENMPWYTGAPLLSHLENVHVASDRNFEDARFPVQWVCRPNQDFRGFAGQIAGGVFQVGDEITALPSGRKSTIKSIVTLDGELQSARAPQSVMFQLEDEIDISRGDTIVTSDSIPTVGKELRAEVCWMSESPLRSGGMYIIKHGTRITRAKVSGVHSKVDIESLDEIDLDEGQAVSFELNDIGTISIKSLQKRLHYQNTKALLFSGKSKKDTF